MIIYTNKQLQNDISFVKQWMSNKSWDDVKNELYYILNKNKYNKKYETNSVNNDIYNKLVRISSVYSSSNLINLIKSSFNQNNLSGGGGVGSKLQQLMKKHGKTIINKLKEEGTKEGKKFLNTVAEAGKKQVSDYISVHQDSINKQINDYINNIVNEANVQGINFYELLTHKLNELQSVNPVFYSLLYPVVINWFGNQSVIPSPTQPLQASLPAPVMPSGYATPYPSNTPSGYPPSANSSTGFPVYTGHTPMTSMTPAPNVPMIPMSPVIPMSNISTYPNVNPTS